MNKRFSLRAILFTIGTALCISILWLLSNEDVKKSKFRHKDSVLAFNAVVLQDQGIQARDVDVASLPPIEKFSMDKLPEFRGLIENHAHDLSMLEKDAEWFETAVALTDPEYVRDERVLCGREWESKINRVCNYEIQTIVNNEGRNSKVVYSRAVPDDEETANSPGCRGFMGCIANTRLGSTVPMPEAQNSDFVAMTESIQSAHLPENMYSVDYVMNSIRLHESVIEDISVHLILHPEDIDATLELRKSENTIRHLRDYWTPELEKMTSDDP